MWYNNVMAALLRSSLHGMLSGSVLLLTYTGRKSGKSFDVPVNYLEHNGELLVVSFRDRTWWRNLRGGAAVQLTLRGKQQPATGTAVEDETQVAEGLAAMLAARPSSGRFLGVTAQDPAERQAQLAAAAKSRVIVRLRLD